MTSVTEQSLPDWFATPEVIGPDPLWKQTDDLLKEMGDWIPPGPSAFPPQAYECAQWDMLQSMKSVGRPYRLPYTIQSKVEHNTSDAWESARKMVRRECWRIERFVDAKKHLAKDRT